VKLLKSLFVTSYIVASNAAAMVAVYRLFSDGAASPWLGTLIACGAPALFFNRLLLAPVARTSDTLWPVLTAGVAGTALALLLAGGLIGWAVWLSLLIGVLASVIYVFWYSRFSAPPASAPLKQGQPLPDFELRDGSAVVTREQLTARPALWVFFRGNWCPLCMAQIKEIAAQYQALAARGVEVYFVSPQSEDRSAALAKKFDAPMRFLTDPDNRVAEQLGILEKNGLPAGFQALGYDSDVPRPSVFITDAEGTVIFLDLTDNYRVRPEPAQFFDVLDRHAAA